MKKPMHSYRIKLSHQTERGLIVAAATEERAHELALQWAQEHDNDPTVTVVSCKQMPDDEVFVVGSDKWTPDP